MPDDPHSSNRFDGPIVIDTVSSSGYLRLGRNTGPQIIPYLDGDPAVTGDIGSLLLYYDRTLGGDADLYQTTNGTTWSRLLSAREIKSAFFPAVYDTNIGRLPVQEVGAAGTGYFGFTVPSDFEDLVSCLLIFVASAGAAGVGRDIDIYTTRAGHGEAYNAHLTDQVGVVFGLTADILDGLALHEVLADMEADDRIGVQVVHNAIGGSLYYTGIELLYTP